MPAEGRHFARRASLSLGVESLMGYHSCGVQTYCRQCEGSARVTADRPSLQVAPYVRRRIPLCGRGHPWSAGRWEAVCALTRRSAGRRPSLRAPRLAIARRRIPGGLPLIRNPNQSSSGGGLARRIAWGGYRRGLVSTASAASRTSSHGDTLDTIQTEHASCSVTPAMEAGYPVTSGALTKSSRSEGPDGSGVIVPPGSPPRFEQEAR